ncbi:hypothetical protein GCM10017776_56170 [Streptomyces griseoluteus]|nr:hypothetical protein GCM10017776_56170 [Streptomyces griseoluteus]
MHGVVPAQVHGVIQGQGKGIQRCIQPPGRGTDRPGGAGMRSGMELPELGLAMRLAQDDRAAADLADQAWGKLPGYIAVHAALVHMPAALNPSIVHGPAPLRTTRPPTGRSPSEISSPVRTKEERLDLVLVASGCSESAVRELMSVPGGSPTAAGGGRPPRA